MSEEYKVKLVRTENPILGIFLNRTMKITAHGQMLKGYPPDVIFMMKKDKSVSHLSLRNYLRIEYSKELNAIVNKKMAEESGGVAKVSE